jgi:hypothetical protein
LPGHAKSFHVYQRKVLARIEKKKVEAPKYKFIWKRKEVHLPRVEVEQAKREDVGEDA